MNNVTDLEEALRISDKFKASVNNCYKLLEIDLDGIIQRLLPITHPPNHSFLHHPLQHWQGLLVLPHHYQSMDTKAQMLP